VLEGSQPGHVFHAADQRESSFVVTQFGFAQSVGSQGPSPLDTVIEGILARPDANLPRYWHWYAPPTHWARRFDEDTTLGVRCRERWRCVFDARSRAVHRPTSGEIELRLLDEVLLSTVSPLGVDLERRFWRSGRDLLANGVGVCAVRDGRVVSLCYSACVAGGEAEIDIVTLPEYRNRGLGRRVADRFLSECVTRQIRPSWDCFTANRASMNLARRLGFPQGRRYSLYSLSLPLALAADGERCGQKGIDR